MVCRQSNSRRLMPLNDLPDFEVQAPGPGPSHPVQIVHDGRGVRLN